MATTSADLNWLLVRNFHCRLVKRTGGKHFSSEKGNLANMHTFHNSGYIHPKVVDVSPAKGGKGVVVTTRKPKAPVNQIAKAALAHNLKSLGSSRKTNKSVGTIVGQYRPELKTLAIARASGILRAQRARKEGKAPRVRGQKTKDAKKTKSA